MLVLLLLLLQLQLFVVGVAAFYLLLPAAAACVQVMRKLMHKVQLQMDDSGAFGRCLGVVCPQ